jgi:hypothetical protein
MGAAHHNQQQSVPGRAMHRHDQLAPAGGRGLPVQGVQGRRDSCCVQLGCL